MNTASLTTVFFACLFFLSFPGLLAQSGSASLDLSDEKLFSPEFFPSISETSQREILLAGLKSLYPRRIVTEPFETSPPDPAPPIIREIEPHGVYIRVKHLPESLPVIKEHLSHPLVVLDLRFLTADLESSLTLGAYLTRNDRFQLEIVGDYPAPSEKHDGSTLSIKGEKIRGNNQTVFTLSNHETRGPIEAVLAQLKINDEIISVGAPTPGKTSVFRSFPELEPYYLISGEIRPTDGESLVETGFVPRVDTDVSETDDRLGYESLREGVSLDDLVQTRVAKPRFDESRLLREHSAPPSREETLDDDDDDANLPEDLILRRALNIVKALEALGKFGS